jgi:HAMP domain-containing protein
MFKKKRTIKQNILSSFIVLSIFSIVLLGIISVSFMVRIGDTTASESTLALKDQIKRNIQNTSEQISQVINQKFAKSEAMIDSLIQETKNILQNGSSYLPRLAYYDYGFQYNGNDIVGPNSSTSPSDTHFDSIYNIFLSWTSSSFYIPGSTLINYISILKSNPILNETIYKLANLDLLFKYVHENSPEFRWLYLTATNLNGSGLFLNYPGSVVGGTQSERQSDPWDPRNDDWYLDIIDDIVFSSPYPDPIDGEPLITIGKKFSVNGLSFVLAGDISIKEVKENILSIKVLDSGYASLISADGTVVAHPEYSPLKGVETFKTIDEVEINVAQTGSEPSLSMSKLNEILALDNGLIEYSRTLKINDNPEERYLSFVRLTKSNYIVLIIVPVEEAIKPVGILQTRIAETTMINMLEILSILAITAIISIIAGLMISNQIIKPINRLTSIASRMSTDSIRKDILGDVDLTIDKDLQEQDDEVGDLTRAFSNMIQSIKTDKISKDEMKINKPSFLIDKD